MNPFGGKKGPVTRAGLLKGCSHKIDPPGQTLQNRWRRRRHEYLVQVGQEKRGAYSRLSEIEVKATYFCKTSLMSQAIESPAATLSTERPIMPVGGRLWGNDSLVEDRWAIFLTGRHNINPMACWWWRESVSTRAIGDQISKVIRRDVRGSGKACKADLGPRTSGGSRLSALRLPAGRDEALSPPSRSRVGAVMGSWLMVVRVRERLRVCSHFCSGTNYNQRRRKNCLTVFVAGETFPWARRMKIRLGYCPRGLIPSPRNCLGSWEWQSVLRFVHRQAEDADTGMM